MSKIIKWNNWPLLDFLFFQMGFEKCKLEEGITSTNIGKAILKWGSREYNQ